MRENSRNLSPSIAVASNYLTARVVIPKGTDTQTLTPQFLASLARERGVEITSEAQASLAEAVDTYKKSGDAFNEVFIRATMPEHGKDSSLEWMPGFNPEAPNEEPAETQEEPVDFYARRTFVMVASGDHVATIHPATEGVDGHDVTGRTLAAKSGKTLGLSLDPSVQLLSDGRVLAQVDGLLTYTGKHIGVDPLLDIRGTVDFSTGNIDFDGDVIVRRDIRDKFRVKATGNVTIEGLIDASYIDCGGSLNARRGVAGREEGTLRVAKDAHIVYLDHVRGWIGGSLHLTRVMTHSDIEVEGDVIAELGVVMGGSLTVHGNARVADIGSATDTPTVVRMGPPPQGETARNPEAERLDAEVGRLRQELDRLRTAADCPETADRVTELTFQIESTKAQADALRADGPSKPATQQGGRLEVLRQINGRVRLCFGSQSVEFTTEVKGPIKIWLASSGVVMCQYGEGAPKPIRDLQGVTDRKAA